MTNETIDKIIEEAAEKFVDLFQGHHWANKFLGCVRPGTFSTIIREAIARATPGIRVEVWGEAARHAGLSIQQSHVGRTEARVLRDLANDFHRIADEEEAK